MMNVCITALFTGFLFQAEVSAKFYYLKELHNVPDARARCQDLGYTDLAVVDSQEKADQAMEVIQKGSVGAVESAPEVWFGLSYDTTDEEFRWADNSTLEWNNWMTGSTEPNDMELGEVCVRIRPQYAYQWGTMFCADNKHALCGLPESDACADSAFFILHTENQDSSIQWMARYLDQKSNRVCAHLCLRHCCSYFLYDNTTCVLFPSTLQLDVSIPRPGAVIYRKI